MIEVIDESTDDILGFRATGKLSQADYREVLYPRLEKSLKQFPTLKVLFLMDESFEGWSLGAAWTNTIVDLKHRRKFDKIAMVGGPRWEQWCAKAVAAPLIGGEIRIFRRAELIQAREWLRA